MGGIFFPKSFETWIFDENFITRTERKKERKLFVLFLTQMIAKERMFFKFGVVEDVSTKQDPRVASLGCESTKGGNLEWKQGQFYRDKMACGV